MRELDVQAISLDWRDDLAANRKQFGGQLAFQGNLDPSLLHGSTEVATQATKKVLASAGDAPGHIFNLGHGITPGVDPGHVQAVVDIVRG